jgi:hypothetical protein
MAPDVAAPLDVRPGMRSSHPIQRARIRRNVDEGWNIYESRLPRGRAGRVVRDRLGPQHQRRPSRPVRLKMRSGSSGPRLRKG